MFLCSYMRARLAILGRSGPRLISCIYSLHRGVRPECRCIRNLRTSSCISGWAGSRRAPISLLSCIPGTPVSPTMGNNLYNSDMHRFHREQSPGKDREMFHKTNSSLTTPIYNLRLDYGRAGRGKSSIFSSNSFLQIFLDNPKYCDKFQN